jgi:hypothetical protein
MTYPTSTSPDLLIHPPHDDDGRMAGSQQNEGWDDSSLLFPAGTAEAAVPTSNVESLHLTATVAAEAASRLDDFLSGEHHHHHKPPFEFVISTPSSNKHEHNLSLPTATKSEYEQKNNKEGEGPCDESSIVSELTQMTYRAELMKQVSSEMILIMCMCFDVFTTAANFVSFSSSMMMQAVMIESEKFKQHMIESEKFKQQKKQHGVEAHPKAIKRMFHRYMSCPDIQKSMTSFVDSTSVKMKAEARQHHLFEEEHDATSDPTTNRRVDELFVEFGVRPARSRSTPNAYEISEENAVRSRPSTEQGAASDNHLDSVIQLKLQLAQKQATLDELSHKYNALLVQKGAQHSMVADNSRLIRENEWLRAQLRQAGITTSATPTAFQVTLSSCNVADSRDHLTPPSPSQPTSFSIHRVIQDRMTSAGEVDSKKVDATTKAHQTRPKFRELKSFGTTTSTATETILATNESPPLHASPNPFNSFSNIIQGWRNRPTTTTEPSEERIRRRVTMSTVDSTKSSDTSRRRRGSGYEWTSALMLQRPPAA